VSGEDKLIWPFGDVDIPSHVVEIERGCLQATSTGLFKSTFRRSATRPLFEKVIILLNVENPMSAPAYLYMFPSHETMDLMDHKARSRHILIVCSPTADFHPLNIFRFSSSPKEHDLSSNLGRLVFGHSSSVAKGQAF
jgi:hypothetical protein